MVKVLFTAIQQMIPEAGIIKVQHSYINNNCGESWESMVWEKAPEECALDRNMFMTYGHANPESLMEAVKAEYIKWTPPDNSAKIAALKAELAKLEG